MRRQGDGEDDNAVARNSFLRLFEDCLAAKSSVAVPVVVAIEITGVRRVRLVELADRTVMVDMVVVLVGVVDQITSVGGEAFLSAHQRRRRRKGAAAPSLRAAPCQCRCPASC